MRKNYFLLFDGDSSQEDEEQVLEEEMSVSLVKEFSLGDGEESSSESLVQLP